MLLRPIEEEFKYSQNFERWSLKIWKEDLVYVELYYTIEMAVVRSGIKLFFW